MRIKLRVLSFQGLRDFYDITTFAKIIATKEPPSLANLIVYSSRKARSFNIGKCRITSIPKSEKTKKSFMYRSCNLFNQLPTKIKSLIFNANFKDLVKDYLYTKEKPPDPSIDLWEPRSPSSRTLVSHITGKPRSHLSCHLSKQPISSLSFKLFLFKNLTPEVVSVSHRQHLRPA